MNKTEPQKTLEERFLLLREEAKGSPISIRTILEILSGKGRSLLLIFLSLPFCQPIQIPGFSTPFGLVIAFFGLRMAFGKRVWLPKSVLSKTMSSVTLKKIVDKSLRFIKKMRKWLHPRMIWICRYGFMRIINGLLVACLGVLLALPLPIPFSNLITAWPILLISIGVLEDDGLFVMVGYLISCTAILFFFGLERLSQHFL